MDREQLIEKFYQEAPEAMGTGRARGYAEKCADIAEQYAKDEVKELATKIVNSESPKDMYDYANGYLKEETEALKWWNELSDKEKIVMSLKHYDVLELNTEQIIFAWRRTTGGELI